MENNRGKNILRKNKKSEFFGRSKWPRISKNFTFVFFKKMKKFTLIGIEKMKKIYKMAIREKKWKNIGKIRPFFGNDASDHFTSD